MEACMLCPRQCHALRTDRIGEGFCGLPGIMRIGRIAPHLWEEPPISGTTGTGAVFFSGCTLRCVYCQNAEISHGGAGRTYTPEQLAEALRRLTDTGVQSISFITGTPWVPMILETLSIWRPPLPLVWNSSGYETVETLRKLEGVMDIYLPDFKHASRKMGQMCAAAPDYCEVACEAIREMVRQTGAPVCDGNGRMLRGTLIRHLILPGATSESITILDWIAENMPEIPVSLMRQYMPCHKAGSIPGLNRRITAREYRRVRDHMLALGLQGYEQEAGSAADEFVPVFNQDSSFV